MNTEGTTEPDSPKPVPTRWLVAVHEATHAAYARAQAMIVRFVTVEGIVAAEDGGEYKSGTALGLCYSSGGTRLGRLRRCELSLVGPAAEHHAGGPDPLPPFAEFIRDAETRHPESDAAKVLGELRPLKQPRVLYELARQGSEKFVHEHWSEIVTLAERFMKEVSLNEESIELVFDPGWPKFRAMLDEKAREDDLAPWVKQAMEEYGVDDPDRIGTDADGGPILLD